MKEQDKKAFEDLASGGFRNFYLNNLEKAVAEYFWQAALEYARGQQPAVWAEEIIDDLQGQFDTDGITHEDSGDALIYLTQAISAVQDAAKRHPAQPVRHPDDVAVDKFAAAMKVKLAQARDKGRSGWEQMNPAELSAMLYEHVQKGDPRDVANFCVFLWNLGQPITPCKPVPPDDSRQAALIDLAYINGAKVGWNMCVTDDESQFQKLTEGVAECVNVLKNTRSQATTQPVQPAVNEQDLRDAARYQWLRNSGGSFDILVRQEDEEGKYWITAYSPNDFDSAIDTAIAAAEAHRKGGV